MVQNDFKGGRIVTAVTKIDKGWGHELIFANTEKYCGKLLNFNTGAKFSMHFHAEKDETWYILNGLVLLRILHTTAASEQVQILSAGETWHNPPLCIHQLICLEEGTIIEVSTVDTVSDNYRVYPGDSQK